MPNWTTLNVQPLGALELRRVESPSGHRADYVVVSYPETVAVLALTEDEQVVLVRQYRPAVGADVLEIPGGAREAGESVEQCAGRELEEETGYKADHVAPLLSVHPSGASIDQTVSLCVAHQLDRTASPAGAEPMEEGITTVLVPFASILEQVLRGEIRDAATVIAVLYHATGTRHRESPTRREDQRA